ncbi:hypothetical protein NQ314_000908 [Rhamnusium bicolor]|uniref:Transposable element P transposase n=1 Tax=Rhamnusium bicolor TaxID=1586634 RepID=A0AAV8ZU06_9CUCU|nr:hypothetical protein NQ314_000908 [Rhamnusium bicolor]
MHEIKHIEHYSKVESIQGNSNNPTSLLDDFGPSHIKVKFTYSRSDRKRVADCLADESDSDYAILNNSNNSNDVFCKDLPVDCNTQLNLDVSPSPPKKPKLKPKHSPTLLKTFNVRRVSQLDPKEKKYYFIDRFQRQRISKLTKKLSESKIALSNLPNIINSNLFSKLLQRLNSAGVTFIELQIKNCKRKRPVYNSQNKAIALALYKRGPRCYRLLKKFFILPSKSTINKYLTKIPLETGINKKLFEKLSIRVRKMNSLNRVCCLAFDEISLSVGLKYEKSKDKVVGYVDLGSIGRRNEIANHALVFLVQGIGKHWKQPVAYYFTKDVIKTNELKILLVEIISFLQSCGLTVMCTVCDQGSTNRSAIKQLITESNSTDSFKVNDKEIIPIFDVPHLLKNTRTGLYNYVIKFSSNREAKFSHIMKCYEIDKMKRFQGLRKLQDHYFKLNQSTVKMKVNIAARTLSASVASAIESMISNPTSGLPSEAINTAEFVSDMDNLFDSLNSRLIKTSNGSSLKSSVTRYSPHVTFWSNMLEKNRVMVISVPSG